jgi:hypothetical protein
MTAVVWVKDGIPPGYAKMLLVRLASLPTTSEMTTHPNHAPPVERKINNGILCIRIAIMFPVKIGGIFLSVWSP